MLARLHAAAKSEPEPVFGLAEESEGVLVGLGANDPRGCVVEMEHRRRSGRAVHEWFFVPLVRLREGGGGGGAAVQGPVKVGLWVDHPLFLEVAGRNGNGNGNGNGDGDEEEGEGEGSGGKTHGGMGGVKTTFEMGVTERQRGVRDGVVLPFLDAQTGAQGGRILYEMGREDEDDFDEEEDEI